MVSPATVLTPWLIVAFEPTDQALVACRQPPAVGHSGRVPVASVASPTAINRIPAAGTTWPTTFRAKIRLSACYSKQSAGRSPLVGRSLSSQKKRALPFKCGCRLPKVTPRQHWLDGHIVLARRRPLPRFRRIDTISARNHVHHFRLVSPTEVDAEFGSWLREAYAVGAQEHLKPRRGA